MSVEFPDFICVDFYESRCQSLTHMCATCPDRHKLNAREKLKISADEFQRLQDMIDNYPP